jgi:hypothetical protein
VVDIAIGGRSGGCDECWTTPMTLQDFQSSFVAFSALPLNKAEVFTLWSTDFLSRKTFVKIFHR